MAVFHFLSHLSFQFEKVCFLFFLLVHCTKLDSAGKVEDCSFNTLLLSEEATLSGQQSFLPDFLKALLSFLFVCGVGVGAFATVCLGMSEDSFPTSPRG